MHACKKQANLHRSSSSLERGGGVGGRRMPPVTETSSGGGRLASGHSLFSVRRFLSGSRLGRTFLPRFVQLALSLQFLLHGSFLLGLLILGHSFCLLGTLLGLLQHSQMVVSETEKHKTNHIILCILTFWPFLASLLAVYCLQHIQQKSCSKQKQY
jgi:hypothetical protein